MGKNKSNKIPKTERETENFPGIYLPETSRNTHLQGFTADEVHMIKLMAELFVNAVVYPKNNK